MAHLARICIYPVKSLEPLELQGVRVLKSGALEGDRAFAMRAADGSFINGKRNPRVHLLRSSFDPLTGLLSLGRAETGLTTSLHVERHKETIEAWLSEFFAIPVTFTHSSEVGFPDDPDCPGPTVVSTATLAEVAKWFPGLDVNQIRLRIRANLEIDGVPPFWEDRLYGPKGTRIRFSIGSCSFDGNNPCQRCTVPPRDPFTGKVDTSFVKTFSAQRERTLPEWAERSRFNHFYRLTVNTLVPEDQAGHSIAVGDKVQIIGPITI